MKKVRLQALESLGKSAKHFQISTVALFHSKLEKVGGIKTFTQYLKQALAELDVKTIQVSYDTSKLRFGLREFLAGKSVYGTLMSRALDYVSLNKLAITLESNGLHTFNVHGEWLFLPTNVVYVHDPGLLAAMAISSSISLAKRVYYLPRDTIWNNMLGLYRKSLVLVNSGYSARLLKDLTDLSGQILYPPVDVHKYREPLAGPHDRPWVVTVSRFSRFKNLEDVLEMARRVRVARFFLIGGVNSRDELLYYSHLQRLIREYTLKNVVFLPNASDQTRMSALSKAKVYFHPKLGEQFGISVVEAMASGLIPVVHASGGPQEDILAGEQGLYGYTYGDLEEAASQITYALNRYRDVSGAGKIVERARDFDYERFRMKLSEILIKVAT